jgi:hypothetical protein
LRSTASYRVIRTEEIEMKNITAYLVGLLVTGCGAGVSSDPTEVAAIPLETAPTPLLANVLATQAVAIGSANDATYVAIVKDDETQTAKLMRGDVRTPGAIEELDHMPIGKGTAQFVIGTNGFAPGNLGPYSIAWGFGGDGSEPATFRIIQGGAPTDIAFADHGPANLINVEPGELVYSSTHDCAIQGLDLATGDIGTFANYSCFVKVESVVQMAHVALMRTADAPGYSVRGFFKAAPVGLNLAQHADTDFVGPFPATAPLTEQDDQPATWSRTDDDGKSHIMTVSTSPWATKPTPAELFVVDGMVDAGAMINGELWGATNGEPTILFHVTHAGTKRYTVDYQPRAMFGLHERIIVLTTDGALLEQPISADN